MKNTSFTKKILSLVVFLLAMTAGVCLGSYPRASAAVKCYTIGTSNVQVYSNAGLTKKYGTIYATDEITVKLVSAKYCKVTYPIARGTKTGYISTGKILTRTTGNNYTARAKITTYRRASNGNSYGYISKGDTVKILGASGSYTQVKYPVSGGYKYAFVSTAQLNAYILPTANSGTISNGTYKLVSALNQKYVMDINGASTSDRANVQLYQDNGTNAQKFRFTRQSDGYYTIANVNSGKMLDCDGAGRINGTNIHQYASNSSAAQRWKVSRAGNGYYTLTCKCNGLLADVSGARAANGTNIHMYAANGTAAQKWKLVPVSVSTVTNNTAKKIVDYELSQVGIGEPGNNNIKYNKWYYGRTVSGSGYAWCMVFQAYCADQLGVLNKAIPRTNNCYQAAEWFRKRGQFHLARYYGGNYTPKAGDLVFYKSDGKYSHVGMITAPPVNGYLQVVEGNYRCSDGYFRVQHITRGSNRTVNHSYVYGYGTPSY